MNPIRLLIPPIVLTVLLTVCPTAHGDEVVSFDDHVKPILQRRCLKCHGNDEQQADLNLQNYATLMKGGSGGPVVKAGRPTSSVMFQAITAKEDAARMPPESPPLPVSEIELIRKWIAAGLRETVGSKSLAASRTVTFDPLANAAMKPETPPHWPRHFPPFKETPTKRQHPIGAMAANPWAPLLAVSGYRQIRLFHIDSRRQIGALGFPEGVPQVLKFSRNGGVLLAAGGKPVQSGRVVLFDVRTGKRLAQIGDELDAVMAADISPDQQQIALGGSARKVKTYATVNGELQYTLERHTDWITEIAFSPDGKRLASADRAGGIHLWSAADGAILLSPSSHSASVRSLSWRGDSQLLASGGEDGKLIWWNAADGFISSSKTDPHQPSRPPETLGKIPNGVLDVVFGSDGRLLTSGRDQHARVWSVDADLITSFSIARATTTQVAFSHDGKVVIIGDSLGEIHFFE